MSLSSSADAPAQARRQRWLSVLAKAPAARLAALWEGLGPVPAYALLRRTAMNENKKIAEVAQSVVTAAELLK